MEFLTLKHSMPAGDLLSILPGLQQVWKDTGKKWIIFQRLNLEYGDLFEAYPGAKYSIKNDAQVPVTMNTEVFEALRPLLLAQPYIEYAFEWDGKPCDYDMDLLRQIDTVMPYGSINAWASYIWPEMTCDLSRQWLKYPNAFPEQAEGKILINRTERYNNMLISYQFLKEYGDNVLFVGLPHEHELFCKQHGLSVDRFEASNFFGIAAAMTMCKMFIGNQSALYQISEGLKIPRILEVCKQMPNVIGYGEDCYSFLNQKNLEYFVHKLFNDGDNGKGLLQTHRQNNYDPASNNANANTAGQSTY